MQTYEEALARAVEIHGVGAASPKGVALWNKMVTDAAQLTVADARAMLSRAELMCNGLPDGVISCVLEDAFKIELVEGRE